jgi:hypothetical protein
LTHPAIFRYALKLALWLQDPLARSRQRFAAKENP